MLQNEVTVADFKTNYSTICKGSNKKYEKSRISSVLLTGLEPGTTRIQVRSFAD